MSRIHHPKVNPRPLREGPWQTVGGGRGRALTTTHPPTAPSPKEKVIFQLPSQKIPEEVKQNRE